MQVGNGDFAFGADVTSLQTFLPFATMSSWGWKNDSSPPNRNMEDVHNYKGESRYNHGRLVQYDFGGDPEIEQWLTANLNQAQIQHQMVDAIFYTTVESSTKFDIIRDSPTQSFHTQTPTLSPS
ncbi:hypothetical protein C8J55DRAFT_567241 [Lentinula edodes]|uniref:Uncharacterized protein n=1 Tax=Lentinula lateritia TaxID=40482 RepID=A0A9W9DDG7_9AGAR|nr:hypothetical protein C8J55DRAFT_567241 [Lentinula edodes]